MPSGVYTRRKDLKLSETTKQKIRATLMGHGVSASTRLKQSLKAKQRTGSKNSRWAGNSVSYQTLHKRITRLLGQPETCENCETNELSGHHIHWANISGEYRHDESDWARLCARCHRLIDFGTLKWGVKRR